MRNFNFDRIARLPGKLGSLLRNLLRHQSERRLTGRNYRDFYERFSIGIYRSSPDGRQLRANPALVRLNGYDSEENYHAVMGDLATEWYVDPTRRAQFKQLLLANGFVENFVSEVYRHKTRERIWVVETARIVPDRSTGAPLYFEGTIQEITETHRKLEIEERFRKISEQVPGCLFQYRRWPDGRAQLPFASARIRDIFGVSPDSVDDVAIIRRMVHPDDRAALDASLDKSAAELSPWNHEYRICLADGTVKWIHGNAMLEREADGSTLWHGYFSDVSDRKAIETKVRELAFQDPLTGLPNRRLMLDRIEQALALSRRNRRWGALLFIDFDGFKTLNDTRGHAAGDHFLVEMSQRLRSAVRETDTVARYSGDEFMMLPQQLTSDDPAKAREEARIIGETLLSAAALPVQLDGVSIAMTASIGIALYRDCGSTAQSLLERADRAMYRAKASGKNSLHIDDQVDHEAATAARIMMASQPSETRACPSQWAARAFRQVQDVRKSPWT